MAQYNEAIAEMLRGFKYMLTQAMGKTTKVYNGIIKSSGDNEKWNVQFNGEIHEIAPYGAVTPAVGKIVKVIIPDNNMSLAFFI